MDPYALAAAEAEAWQNEAARTNRQTAAELRAVADDLDERSKVAQHGTPAFRATGSALRSHALRLRAVADRLDGTG
jgi:hypothetical protein